MILFGRSTLIALSVGNLLVASSQLPVGVDSTSLPRQRSDSTSTHSSTIRGVVTGAALGAVAGFAASLLVKFSCEPQQIGSGGQQGTCDNSIEHRANVVITVSGATIGAIIGGVMAHRRSH
jgi:hypothetical protein